MSGTARVQLSFISPAQQLPLTPFTWPFKQLIAHSPRSSSAVTFCRALSSATGTVVARRRQELGPQNDTTPCTGAGSTGEPGGWGAFLPPNKAGLGPSSADKGLGAATHSSSS